MNINIEKEDNEIINISVNGVAVYSCGVKRDLASLFEDHRGATEYTGIVADIQTWYYGSVIKASWCATAVSYFCNMLGILNKIGGKAENVYTMYQQCKKSGKGVMYEADKLPEKLLRNDILFFLWSSTVMTESSSKHVCVCEYDTESDQIFCIGGNQKDKICTVKYDKKYLYAVYRIN